MKIISYLQLIFVILFVGQISCDENNDIELYPSTSASRKIIDSIGISKVLACFAEDKSITIIERITNNKTRKLIFREGYPLYTDSLIYIKPNEYRSPKLHTTYLIKDSTVLVIQYAKIIHPSSNWQGQTPWSQPYVMIYPRLDKY